ncbi:hypothetical protein Misp01_23330 [Microtetraspora sp. NBRC 13810]|uniref:hypothetical protein n=1 Tax=Microtetraspora sp. NBRC 13810 TaxID=3030990 RepID=UPI00249FBE74|nr:hypothetical protein [Microtetraspora sp. NBRC 13810]GLW07203.1 hypothetical protein Misp01_23330 [Microtetraspora sp. NBRC 13810]
MLTHVDQDIGVLSVTVPPQSPPEPADIANYRITARRLHHPSSREPFIVLTWVEAPLDDVRADEQP